ncbi:hypothetical protein ACS0TY_029951 [Phlomoides rotata]
MDCENKKCLEKALPPLPPPVPLPFLTNHGLKMCKKGCFRNSVNSSWDRLFDEAYGADVSILTDGGAVIYAHAAILGNACPVLKAMLNKLKSRRRRSISIRGVPPGAVRAFIRFLYSSWYEEEEMNEFALPLLVLSHAYSVGELKRVCECWLETKLMNTENVMDIFQVSMLCDAPRLSFFCHRFVVSSFKAVSATDGWNDMKKSHPVLEKEIRASLTEDDAKQKERTRKEKERKVYVELYEAMEALVHICKDGCRTIGPHDKVFKDDHAPCEYTACKGLEALIRHFAGCKMRGPGGCIHCKRMWQLLELHSWLCADSDACKVPLCR